MSSTRREYEMFFKITGAMGGSFSAAMRNSSSEMKALQTATRTLTVSYTHLTLPTNCTV